MNEKCKMMTIAFYFIFRITNRVQMVARKGKYNKHKWKLFSSWTGIGKKQAHRLAAKVMTYDFNIAGGPAFKQWPGPTDKKIGPFVRKLVRIGVFFCILADGSMIC